MDDKLKKLIDDELKWAEETKERLEASGEKSFNEDFFKGVIYMCEVLKDEL